MLEKKPKSKLRGIKKKPNFLFSSAKKTAEQVEKKKDEYRSLTDEDIKKRIAFIIEQLANKNILLDDVLVDGLAIAREIIYRKLNIFAYKVQLIGACVIYKGNFAEMLTGEGKTITIMLASFVAALRKKGVHVITVNEYLVKRDAEDARNIFEEFGISVGYNTSDLNQLAKKEMFNKDITYTTNSELGFDYLRDNMVDDINKKVIRDLDFAIIDEADSILIDESRVPLIISGRPRENSTFYLEVDKFVKTLKKADYLIDLESRTIALTDQGAKKANTYFDVKNIYSTECAEIVHKLNNALMANYIFKNGVEYLVKDNKILLIDNFTGRILQGRSYNAGLQQAIQAKEGVEIEPENQTLATITYQSFFVMYNKLSALSGTAFTESEEFLKIYNLVVVQIPPNKPVIRKDMPDFIFGKKYQKWNHVVNEIIARYQKGQPVLVGTSSVNDSELLHQRLLQHQIPHEVLNARNHFREAEIIKNAGQKNAVTISTNMAGRGIDIKLSPEVIPLGGLYVIGTERHESRRIDNQLRGRSGRQGDVGESRFFTSLEDSLFKRFATDRFAKASDKLENEDFFDSKFFSNFLNKTQKKVEGLNFDVRRNLLNYDYVLSLQRELIYKQRDQILKNENSVSIILNMAKEISEDVVKLSSDSENFALVNKLKFCTIINSKIINFNYFISSQFNKMKKLDAQIKLDEILKIYIKKKYDLIIKLYDKSVINHILLSTIDAYWTEHLDKTIRLRESVNLRSYEQKSPLNIYIEEANELFNAAKHEIVHAVISKFSKLKVPDEEKTISMAFDNYFKN